ncbi:hypothetical protein K9M48_01825 [Candidatus Gracilibacteria bacterium]|nr:hypothetical protein [Candidatus Gracilibacteria bacterium]
MYKLKLLLLSIIVFVSANFANVFAISIYVPSSQGNEDIVVTGPTQVETNEGTLFEIIQIVNQYLWFAIGFFCLIVLIIGGFKILSAEGNAEKLKKANKLIIGSVIGIFIAVLSYAAVRLIVNLFQ